MAKAKTAPAEPEADVVDPDRVGFVTTHNVAAGIDESGAPLDHVASPFDHVQEVSN